MIKGNDKLKKRAKRKWLNVPIIKHFLDLESPLHSQYLTTLSCSGCLRQENGKVISRYCKRKWCNVCNPIRTAVRINNYQEQLSELGQLHFTTLTIQSCNYWEIKEEIKKLKKSFTQFRNSYKKKYGCTFRGVYNIEITYNLETKLYHPHLHIIHEALEIKVLPGNASMSIWTKNKNPIHLQGCRLKFSNELIEYHLKHYPECSLYAQDTRLCNNLIEGFKYQALSVFKIKIDGKKQPFIPVKELDKLYQALHGVQLFNAFGLKKVKEDKEEEQMDNLTAYESEKPDGLYIWQRHDWWTKSGVELSGFIPKKSLIDFYEKLQWNFGYQSIE